MMGKQVGKPVPENQMADLSDVSRETSLDLARGLSKALNDYAAKKIEAEFSRQLASEFETVIQKCANDSKAFLEREA